MAKEVVYSGNSIEAKTVVESGTELRNFLLNSASSTLNFFKIKTANGGKACIFVYDSDGEFQSEFVTEGVEANEQKKMIYLFESDEQGCYKVADRAQVIADRSRFNVSARKNGTESFLILGGIKKVIKYKQTSGYPDVKVSPLDQIELRVGSGRIERPVIFHSARSPLGWSCPLSRQNGLVVGWPHAAA